VKTDIRLVKMDIHLVKTDIHLVKMDMVEGKKEEMGSIDDFEELREQ
jgi:hypothetical protein